MKILAQIDTSRDGNNCYHYEVWSLVDLFGGSYVLRPFYGSGYDAQPEVEVLTIAEMGIDHPEILQRLLNLL